MHFLKNLLQLVLSPTRGWEDVSATMPSTAASAADPSAAMLKHNYIPLIAVASLTEVCRLFYGEPMGVVTMIEIAIALFGSYFLSYFVARILLDNLLTSLVTGEPSKTRTEAFVIYGLSMLAIIEMIDNVIPSDLTLILFLPVFVALMLFKGAKFMAVRPDCEMRFFLVSTLSVVAVPLGLFSLLKLMII